MTPNEFPWQFSMYEIFLMGGGYCLQNLTEGKPRSSNPGAFPFFSGKVLIVSRTLLRMFLVGASNSLLKTKRTNREILEEIGKTPQKNRESPQKDRRGWTSPDHEAPPLWNPPAYRHITVSVTKKVAPVVLWTFLQILLPRLWWIEAVTCMDRLSEGCCSTDHISPRNSNALSVGHQPVARNTGQHGLNNRTGHGSSKGRHKNIRFSRTNYWKNLLGYGYTSALNDYFLGVGNGGHLPGFSHPCIWLEKVMGLCCFLPFLNSATLNVTGLRWWIPTCGFLQEKTTFSAGSNYQCR